MTVAESVSAATQCPCHRFSNTKSIYEALTSGTSTNEVIDWLSGRHAEENIQKQGRLRLSCNSSDRCGNRVNTSFSILNDIRSACRDYLEGPNQTTLEESRVTYETSFPSLLQTTPAKAPAAKPNTLITRKNPKAKKYQTDSAPEPQQRRPIRRIRPAIALSPSDKGNIANLQCEPLVRNALPASIDSSPLEKSPSTTMQRAKKGSLPPQALATVSNKGSTGSRLSDEPLARPARLVGGFQKAVASEPSKITLHSNRPRDNSMVSGAFPQSSLRVITPTSFPSAGHRTGSSTEVDSTGNVPSAHAGPSSHNTLIPSNDDKDMKNFVYESHQHHGDLTSGSHQSQPLSSMPEGSSDLVSKTNTDTPTWALQTPTKAVVPVDKAEICKALPAEMVEHLSELYTSLIINNLVPSTPLELRFLIGLLTVEDSASRTPAKDAIHNILISPKAVRAFAVQSLTMLQTLLGNLHLQVLSALIECPPVRELLPELTTELSARFRERRESLVTNDIGFGGGIQPILTLPFDENRDSRHNYKSREEAALYRNREESRDAFLYQLRSFQNIRGRVLDTSELEASLVKIKRSAGNVVKGVDVHNMHWFAQFFSELLLQIGLVPMEETDKELLQITDKDKLQRLHKRFSSKVGTSKGSSIKMVEDLKDSGSPEKEAHQLFPGHQEFFFLFLQAADSYCFGAHLKSRLVASILSLESNTDLKGILDRMMKLQLLAKFLGVLLFSPNWHTSAVSGVLNSVSNDEISIWTGATELSILPLLEVISKAKNKQHLLSTIPWVLELLRMAKWDAISMRSSTVRSIVARLISLRDAFRTTGTPSLQLVSFSLESFFHQIVGLRHTHSIYRLPMEKEMPSLDESAVDFVELEVSKTFLFATVSHMDEFLTLLTSIAITKSKSVGTPRKMRPSMVSSSTISFSNLPTNDDVALPIAAPSQGALPGSQGAKGAIIGKLVDLFFHQHGDLREICEFVAARAVQKAMVDVQHHFLSEYFVKVDQSKFATEESEIRSELEREAQDRALQVFEASLGSTISQAVSMLSMPSKSAKVKEIAATLALDHVKKSSRFKVNALVKVELTKYTEAYLRKEKRRLFAAKTDS
ncbi:hypothetical protein MHU86_14005 [Fragilaria crotonensis]|nr:hypothetical protein MHU86_14005 [Fragilaria crotonensis]